jgi:hypothetical protein
MVNPDLTRLVQKNPHTLPWSRGQRSQMFAERSNL